MHLLVLSAFRLENDQTERVSFLSQCTFWCSVLSDRGEVASDARRLYCLNAPFGAQCFPTVITPHGWLGNLGLNAPFGAQCFPTAHAARSSPGVSSLNAPFGAQCFPTLHPFSARNTPLQSQCTFWCSVLSDQARARPARPDHRSQCTFWCSVLSDAVKS